MRIGNGKSAKNLLPVIFVLAFCLCPVFGLQADAKGKYEFTETEGVLTGTYDGSTLKKTYVTLKTSGGTYQAVKPCTADSKIYYFDGDGAGTVYTGTAFIKITYNGKTNQYYSKKGTLQKDKIVGSKKAGYHYVDSTGAAVTDKTTELAVKFVRNHTKDSQSQSKKLSSCYYYLSKHYKYKRYYSNLYPKANSMKNMAYDMLKYKQGNCHRYAAAFAYIAKVLGYDSRVVVGSTSARSGGMTPHGWTEVKKDGKWYVCDPDMEMLGVSAYMRTTTPYRTSVTRRCTITAKNGKVSWK